MREALLKLQGKIGPNEEDLLDFTSICKADIKKDSINIEYDESEISGIEGSISKIIISPEAVTLNRMGKIVTTMVFIESQETSTDIITPLGIIKLTVFTTKLTTSLSKNHIKLELAYTFSLGGERINNYLTLNCHIR